MIPSVGGQQMRVPIDVGCLGFVARRVNVKPRRNGSANYRFRRKWVKRAVYLPN
jgi:hypothetical protein